MRMLALVMLILVLGVHSNLAKAEELTPNTLPTIEQPLTEMPFVEGQGASYSVSDQTRACRQALPKAQLALAKNHAHMLRTLAVRPTSDPLIDITNRYDRHTRICTVTIRLTWPTVYTYPPVKLATDYRVPTP